MHFVIFSLLVLSLFIGRCSGEDATRHHCGQFFAREKKGILNFSTEDELNSTTENFISCSWTIEMEVGHKVALTIKELKLDINDSLVITEHLKEGSDAELSNRRFYVLKPGSVIFSRSNKLTVEMIVLKEHISRFAAVFEDSECGGTISEDNGEIEVPLFVHLAQEYHQCKWKLVAPEDKIVKLSFSQFYLAPGSCIFEGLTVQDGEPNGILGDYCEENAPAGSLISTRNSMIIEFTKRPSFEINRLSEVAKISMAYEFVDPCESKIKARYGTVSVPHTYAAMSPPQEVCQWELTVPEGHHISLIFLRYTTGPNVPGQRQEIQIYDGMHEIKDNINGPKITGENAKGLMWSTNDSVLPPFHLTTASNNLRIVRTTKKNAINPNGISFKAFFQAKLNLESSADECVNIGDRRFFPCSNGHYIDCQWRCDGVTDCADGVDEAVCPASNYEIVEEDDNDSATNAITFIFTIALTGSAFAIFSLLTLINRKAQHKPQDPAVGQDDKKHSNYRYYVDLKQGDLKETDLPSYSEVIDAEVMFAIAKSKARKTFDESVRHNMEQNGGTFV